MPMSFIQVIPMRIEPNICYSKGSSACTKCLACTQKSQQVDSLFKLLSSPSSNIIGSSLAGFDLDVIRHAINHVACGQLRVNATKTATLVSYAVSAGWDVNSFNYNRTMLNLACCNNNLVLAGLLVKHGASVHETFKYAVDDLLIHLLRNRLRGASKFLIDNGVYLGGWHLVVVCENGYADLLDIFIQKGVDVNYKNPTDERTALRGVCRRGDMAMFNRLIEAGADINVADKGVSILAHACASGNLEMVKRLFDMGVSTRVAYSNQHAYNNAVASKNQELVDFLISKGIDGKVVVKKYNKAKK